MFGKSLETKTSDDILVDAELQLQLVDQEIDNLFAGFTDVDGMLCDSEEEIITSESIRLGFDKEAKNLGSEGASVPISKKRMWKLQDNVLSCSGTIAIGDTVKNY